MGFAKKKQMERNTRSAEHLLHPANYRLVKASPSVAATGAPDKDSSLCTGNFTEKYPKYKLMQY